MFWGRYIGFLSHPNLTIFKPILRAAMVRANLSTFKLLLLLLLLKSVLVLESKADATTDDDALSLDIVECRSAQINRILLHHIKITPLLPISPAAQAEIGEASARS